MCVHGAWLEVDLGQSHQYEPVPYMVLNCVVDCADNYVVEELIWL